MQTGRGALFLITLILGSGGALRYNLDGTMQSPSTTSSARSSLRGLPYVAS